MAEGAATAAGVIVKEERMREAASMESSKEKEVGKEAMTESVRRD